jgi:acetylglutamate kinase
VINITVVKIGGNRIQETSVAAQVICDLGHGPLAVVHGGGLQINRMLERANHESTFIDGLRVTDAPTLKAVALALIGEVQTELVLALNRAGLPAVGLFGVIRAVRKEGPWGYVGANVTADVDSLLGVIERGKVPVIPTFAIGPDTLLNVNGDETAAAVAVALRAARLVFITDVPGVKDARGAVIPAATSPAELLGCAFVSGGMVPKLRAVKAALEGGVQTVRVGQTVFGRNS